jgi:hypothetical protein
MLVVVESQSCPRRLTRHRTPCRPTCRATVSAPWKAAFETLKDPEFVAEAEKARMT